MSSFHTSLVKSINLQFYSLHNDFFKLIMLRMISAWKFDQGYTEKKTVGNVQDNILPRIRWKSRMIFGKSRLMVIGKMIFYTLKNQKHIKIPCFFCSFLNFYFLLNPSKIRSYSST